MKLKTGRCKPSPGEQRGKTLNGNRRTPRRCAARRQRPKLREAGAGPGDAVGSLSTYLNISARFRTKGRPSPGARHSLKCRYGRTGVQLRAARGRETNWAGAGTRERSGPATGLGRLAGTSACQRGAPPASECPEAKNTASPDSVCGEVMLRSTT